MLLELIFPKVLHAIAILHRTEVQALVTCHALSLMSKNRLITSFFQCAGVLVLEYALYLHVQLDDVVDVPVQKVRSVLVSLLRKFAVVEFGELVVVRLEGMQTDFATRSKFREDG
jgi:hypothetical protein